MTHEEEGAASAKKEVAVLSDASLAALAREVASVSTKLSMLLNVPTFTLIVLKLKAGEVSDTQNSDQAAIKAATEYLLYWKQMRATAKDKDKVAEMERVLKDVGKPEAADVFADKSRDNQELTADCFS